MNYELFYLVGGTKEPEMEKIKKEVEKIITDSGGVFEEIEVVEKRRLAYQINHESHGVYIARRFSAEGQNLDEIIKKMNLNPQVLR